MLGRIAQLFAHEFDPSAAINILMAFVYQHDLLVLSANTSMTDM
jgi:hypothetical protein